MLLFIFLLLFVSVLLLEEIIIFSAWFPNISIKVEVLTKGFQSREEEEQFGILTRINVLWREWSPCVARCSWICEGGRKVCVWQDAPRFSEEVVVGAHMAREWCTMWVMVCRMCMEELLYGLQIYPGCCIQWTAMFGNVGSAWWGWSSRYPMVVFCMAHAMLRQ